MTGTTHVGPAYLVVVRVTLVRKEGGDEVSEARFDVRGKAVP